MLEILFSWLSIPRAIGIWIDTIAYSLIDNAYNIIVTFSKGTLLKEEFIVSLMNNLYVVIGIFALFRIAILLINSIINPDKLSEKGNGLANVFGNFIIMFVMLVMTPFVFREAINLQTVIVDGNYIQKLFIKGDAMEGKNPGKAMRSIAIGSLITLDEVALEQCEGGGTCSNKAKEAIEAYRDMEKNGFSFPTLSKYIGVSIKDDDTGEVVYVYNYMFIVTFAAGIFIAYVLFSFGIDIAVRMVELTVLQILAPLFIVTYIDPKSAKSGTFHKWLTTVGKTYASLFIKLAILSLMLLLISIVSNLDYYGNNLDLSGFEKLVLLFAILIFAKKAPKWIGDMIGVEGAGLGGLGIGKKLGGAALVGGAINKGIDNYKKKKMDNFKKRGKDLKQRTLGGIGAGIQASKQKVPNEKYADRLNRIRGAAKAQSQNLRAQQNAENDFRAFAGIRDGINAGRKAYDPTFRDRRENKISDADIKAKASLKEVGMDAASINKRKKLASDITTAEAIYGKRNNFFTADGEFDKKRFPISDGQLNNVYSNVLTGAGGEPRLPQTPDEMYLAMWAKENGGRVNCENGRIVSVTNSNGQTYEAGSNEFKNIISSTQSGISSYGQAIIAQTAYKNEISAQNEYASNIKLRDDAVQNLSSLTNNLNQFLSQKLTPQQISDLSYAQNPQERENAIISMLPEEDRSSYKTFKDAVSRSQAAIKELDKSIKNTEDYYSNLAVDYLENPSKDPTTVEVNGRHFNKIGEYIPDGQGGYIFEKKDMSQLYDVVTAEQNKKLEKQFDKAVEDNKPVEIKEQEKK